MTLTHPILIVEDDPNDAFFLRRAFSKLGKGPSVWVCVDAKEAKERLGTTPSVAGRQPPRLIVLDLALPDESGLSFLRWLKTSEAWRGIPVAVLTGSDHPQDRDLALALGATVFCKKPQSLDGFGSVVESILTKTAS